MVYSKFVQLGARAVRGLKRAPLQAAPQPFRLPESRSYLPTIPVSNQLVPYSTYDSHYYYQAKLQNKRLQPFCTTATNEACKEGTEEQMINVTFVDKDGEEKQIKVPVGMSMLEAAHENDIELEGACEGSLACSTCHVIVMDMEYYNKLEGPTDEENDMLDLAFGLTETSRLGCQVIAAPELDGVRLALPPATRNFAVDGYKPKPH